MKRKATNFFIKAPGKIRRSFALIRREFKEAGTSNQIIDLPEIDIINKNFQSGKLTREQAAAEMGRIRDQQRATYLKLNGLGKPPIPAQNLALLEDYWNKKYAPKHIIDPVSAKNRLYRAVAAVGDLSLLTAEEHELAARIKDNVGNQRDIVSALRQLLHYLGRTEITLHRPRKKRIKISYVTMDEFKLLVRYIADPIHRDICWVGIATGCRIGEVFFLMKDNFVDGCMFIDCQMDSKTKKERDTKNRRQRDVVVLPEGHEALRRWLEIKPSEREKYRNVRFPDLLAEACKKVGLEKKVTYHDLRHSYAIHLLGSGTPIDLVAQALGDSVAVTQEYYTGFSLSKQGLDAIKKLLRSQI